MKKIVFKLMLVMLIAFGIPTKTQAQWITAGTPFNWFAQPDNTGIPANWTRSIGIGYFNTPGAFPQSFLHINTFGMILPTNGSIPTFGNLFRTDGTNTVDNMWQMFTGTTAGNVTEKFSLFVSAHANNVFLQATQNGHLFFNTNSITRLTIDSIGFVGIGTQTPKAKLEVANGDIAVTAIGSGIILKATNGNNYYRITVDNTGKLITELITKL